MISRLLLLVTIYYNRRSHLYLNDLCTQSDDLDLLWSVELPAGVLNHRIAAISQEPLVAVAPL